MDSVFEREDCTEFHGSAPPQINGPARQIARRFWQPDAEAQVCSIANCDNVFTCSWGGERRHHCRQCGRVVCGSCSRAQVLPLFRHTRRKWILSVKYDPSSNFLAPSGPIRMLNPKHNCLGLLKLLRHMRELYLLLFINPKQICRPGLVRLTLFYYYLLQKLLLPPLGEKGPSKVSAVSIANSVNWLFFLTDVSASAANESM